MDRETVLEPGELVIGVRLASSAGSRSTYRELREKQSFDWPLVSCAARVELDGNRVKDCRVILGAVAPVPLRSRAAEQVLKGQTLTPETARAAAAAAFANAKPLSQNAFKVDLGQIVVRDALLELAKGA
jgi:xanthine dehydrogenase YagS FAD-binding subunit